MNISNFDPKKIIGPYNRDGAYVGREFYFADNCVAFSDGIGIYSKGMLSEIGGENRAFPFVRDGKTGYQFIYPVEEKKPEMMSNEEMMYLLSHCEVMAKTADAGLITTDWCLSDDVQLDEPVKDGTMVRGFFGKFEWEPATRKFFNRCIGADDE